jgi:hypothetical protein
MLSHYPSNINSKPKTNTIQKKKKKTKDPSSGSEESGDEEVERGRERERKREPVGNPHILAGSLCILATDPIELGFRPDLPNPCTYTCVDLTVLAGSGRIRQTHARKPA